MKASAGMRHPAPPPPPMLTLSLPSVARATVQPAVDRPDHVGVGHEDVVEEDLVEVRVAGRHLQRPDRDAVGLAGR